MIGIVLTCVLIMVIISVTAPPVIEDLLPVPEDKEHQVTLKFKANGQDVTWERVVQRFDGYQYKGNPAKVYRESTNAPFINVQGCFRYCIADYTATGFNIVVDRICSCLKESLEDGRGIRKKLIQNQAYRHYAYGKLEMGTVVPHEISQNAEWTFPSGLVN